MYRLLALIPITLTQFVILVRNEKNTAVILEPLRLSKYFLLVFFVLYFIAETNSQNPEKNIVTSKDLIGGQTLPTDTLKINDSTRVSVDTLVVARDTIPLPKSDIETTINYSARDSINFSVTTKIVKLYGDAKIKYGNIELEANQITIDYTKNTITAMGRRDSTGKKIGFPIFKNGSEVYETKDITYNFKTGRARITNVVTQQGEGFLHGETVFKNEKNELFSINNTYTTCNLEHPHFRIRSKRTKAIPKDKIVSGPFNLEINDVPTPLGFAFGMFPDKKESASGIIVPRYGEERNRGFFLRNGGYFFDISDYMKVALTGDVYSKGGLGLQLLANYKKRYAYNGSFNFTYSKTRIGNGIEESINQNDYRLTWNFTPETKGTGRFSASVNAATSSFNQNNFLGVNSDFNTSRLDNQTRKLSSNISYSKSFPGSPFSLGLSMRHNQDVRTKEVDLLLPSLTFNMANIYPFRKKNSSSNSWAEKISLRYSLVGTNNVTNNLGRIGDATTDSIAPFDFSNFNTFLKNARNGFQHTIPLATSFKVLKYFTASPSLNYTERWYFEQLNWQLDPENPTQAIVKDTVRGFNRVYNYSTSISFNTRLYGYYAFKKGSVKAIRHVINPSVSLSYTPDFSDTTKFPFYQRLKTETGQEIVRSRYQGFAYGAPSQGESGSISLSLTNTLEMKVKTKKDTADKARKVPILNNFGFSTGYNMVADSFKLSNISFRANTAVFNKKLTINFNGTIDPYIYALDSTGVRSDGDPITYQRRLDQYAWNNGNGLGQISRATIAMSTSLNPKAREKDSESANKISNSDLSQADKDFLINNPDAYVDFEIPWNLRLNYSLNLSKTGFEKANITQTLRVSGDFSLTEKWKFNFTSGYDFQNKQFTNSSLGIDRDLHCWTMNFQWVPFGFYQSYNFTIRVKSSLLQDLKIDRKRSFQDR